MATARLVADLAMHGKKESVRGPSVFEATDIELIDDADWAEGENLPGDIPGEKLPDAGFFNQFDDDFDESDMAL